MVWGEMCQMRLGLLSVICYQICVSWCQPWLSPGPGPLSAHPSDHTLMAHTSPASHWSAGPCTASDWLKSQAANHATQDSHQIVSWGFYVFGDYEHSKWGAHYQSGPQMLMDWSVLILLGMWCETRLMNLRGVSCLRNVVTFTWKLQLFTVIRV